jgi:hypothetical protein
MKRAVYAIAITSASAVAVLLGGTLGNTGILSWRVVAAVLSLAVVGLAAILFLDALTEDWPGTGGLPDTDADEEVRP